MLGRIVSLRLHPGDELGMEYDVFLECVSGFIHEIHMYVGVIRIDFATSLVYRQNTGSMPEVVCVIRFVVPVGAMVRQANVAAAVFLHFLVQFRVCFAQAVDERLFFRVRCRILPKAPRSLAISTEERYALSATVWCTFCKFGSLFSAVTQSQCCSMPPSAVMPYDGAAALSALL